MEPVFCEGCGTKLDLSISDTCPTCGRASGKGGPKKSYSSSVSHDDSAAFGLDENIASALCYVLGWLTGIVFLLVEKDNKTVRFHAMQSILVFLPLMILGWLLGAIVTAMTFGAGYYGAFGIWSILGLIGTLIFVIEIILWLVLMYKAYMGEKFMVPIAGAIAAKQLE